MSDAASAAATVHAYHRRSKHHLDRYAAGPEALDWDAQPDPFRQWQGTRRHDLPRHPPAPDIPWSALGRTRPPAPLAVAGLAALLRISVAITAWKQYGPDRWALRVHPSSGNLHPTESWVIARRVEGLADGLYHYQSRDHALEWRAGSATGGAAAGLWLGFTSISWREAWKYGERAFRYCQLDIGHVLAALAYAAALLGWQPRLLSLSHAAMARCLGSDRPADFAAVEAEEPEVIVAIYASDSTALPMPPPDWDEWSGLPSRLDPKPMYRWPVIDEVAAATQGSVPQASFAHGRGAGQERDPRLRGDDEPAAARVILNRRSAQAFDGRSLMPAALFRSILAVLLPGGSPVWRMWALPPRVHPVLLLHRVDGIAPGLYILPRSDASCGGLAAALRREFEWVAADPELPLYRLVSAKAERTARTVSCHQAIAGQSAFTMLFLAEFEAPIEEDAAAYRHLHWEAGMLGHCATLEAEAAGWRGTGIGCFFDDADHELLGLGDNRYQVIYHYAIGMALDDPRITTLPAYE